MGRERRIMVTPPEHYPKNSAGNDEQGGNDLGLRGMPPNIVFAVDPDLFNQKTLYSVDDQVEGKQSTGNGEFFPEGPEQKE
jgi:hypothetical protein